MAIALVMGTDCAAKSPQEFRICNNLGNCYPLLGRHFPAIAWYQEAVALKKGNMEAHYYLAIRIDNVGLTFLAKQSYEVFYKLATLTFLVQQRYFSERHQELLHESKRPGGGKVGPR